jgi:hypothetical protein
VQAINGLLRLGLLRGRNEPEKSYRANKKAGARPAFSYLEMLSPG